MRHVKRGRVLRCLICIVDKTWSVKKIH